MDYNKIKIRISLAQKEINVSTKKMSDDLDFTPQGYRKWFIEETLRVRTVISIADYLKVSPAYLLFGNLAGSDTGNMVNEPPSHYGKEYLEQRLDRIEQELKELKRAKQ